VLYDVVGLGLCTHDYIAIIPHMPKFESSVGMKASSEQGGGPAATAMVAASRLGARAAFVGRVGDDRSGHFILADFARYGVDTAHMSVQAGAESHFIICLVEESTGDRAFIGNRATVAPMTPAELNYEIIRDAKFLHLDGHEPAAAKAAALAAREAGVTVVMDASYRRRGDELLGLTDILIASRFFYEGYREEWGPDVDPLTAAQRLLALGPREVIITLGREGCACACAGQSFLLPAFAVTPVVDTTGCGDVFHGAYIAAKLLDYDFRRAAQFAGAAAGLKVRKIGGRLGIPTKAEVLRFLHEQLPAEWPAAE
jgi:sulfofructose kinase